MEHHIVCSKSSSRGRVRYYIMIYVYDINNINEDTKQNE